MAAGKTYEPIGTTTLGSAQASVSFDISSASNQNYTDLFLVLSTRFSNKTTGEANVHIRFNNDESSIYGNTYLVNLSSGNINSQSQFYISAGGNEISERYSVAFFNFFNYSNSTTYKHGTWSYGFPGSHMQLWSGVWMSTAAITRVDVLGGGTSLFATGSTFTLYGIKAA